MVIGSSSGSALYPSMAYAAAVMTDILTDGLSLLAGSGRRRRTWIGSRVQNSCLRGKSGMRMSCSRTVDLPELSSPMTTILGGVRLASDLSSARSGSRILNILVRSDVTSAAARGDSVGGGTMLTNGRSRSTDCESHSTTPLRSPARMRSMAAFIFVFSSSCLPIETNSPSPPRFIGERSFASSQLSMACRS